MLYVWKTQLTRQTGQTVDLYGRWRMANITTYIFSIMFKGSTFNIVSICYLKCSTQAIALASNCIFQRLQAELVSIYLPFITNISLLIGLHSHPFASLWCLHYHYYCYMIPIVVLAIQWMKNTTFRNLKLQLNYQLWLFTSFRYVSSSIWMQTQNAIVQVSIYVKVSITLNW